MNWRRRVDAEAAGLAEGTLEVDEAVASRLFPESLLTDTDVALDAFEAEVRRFEPPSDDEVFGVIERVVLDLNRINREHGGGAYETAERELLCDYIDESLGEAGVDIEALAQRRGIDSWELTDEWRTW